MAEYVNQDVLNKIQKKVIEIMAEEYVVDKDKDFQNLITQAKEVQSKIKYAKENLSTITKSISNINIRNEIKKEENQVKNTYRYIYKYFLPSFFKFFELDEKPRFGLVVVRSEKDNTAELVKLPLTEMFNLMIENGGRMPRFITKNELMRIKNAEIISDNGNETDLQKSANAAYTGTLNRLERYWQLRDPTYDTRTSKKGKQVSRQKQQMILMWKIGHYWQLATVTNYGDVNEAYAAAYLNKNNGLPTETGTEPYYSHELIKNFYWSYIRKVTNLKAILNEDIMLDNLEYAVKSKGAQLPGLKQFEKTADFIIKLKNKSFKKNLEQEINKNFGEQIEAGIRNKYLGQIDDSFESIEKELENLDFSKGKGITVTMQKADLRNIANIVRKRS